MTLDDPCDLARTPVSGRSRYRARRATGALGGDASAAVRTPTPRAAAAAIRGSVVLLAMMLWPAIATAEIFVEVGTSLTRVESKIADRDDTVSRRDGGLHLGVGARRRIGERSDIGARLEADRIDSDLLLTVRALDYRYHVTSRFAVSAFVGAARLDLATPAYGYYLGLGVQLKELSPRWDLGLDLRYGDKVARDNLLPSDPQGGSPDNFHDISGASLYLSYRF